MATKLPQAARRSRRMQTLLLLAAATLALLLLALPFPAAADGQPVVAPGTRSVELVLRDLAGVPERRFTW